MKYIIALILCFVTLIHCVSASKGKQKQSEFHCFTRWNPLNEIEKPVIVESYINLNYTNRTDVIIFCDYERISNNILSYNDVEEKPIFQGYNSDFRTYLATHLTYPIDAQNKGISGRVVVSFTVNQYGRVTNISSPVKIDLLSAEVERVVKSSPVWKPGRQNEKNVNVICYTFVEFIFNEHGLSATIPQIEIVYDYFNVEEKPLFEGKFSILEFVDYVRSKFIYPLGNQTEHGVPGRILVEFIIDKNGYLINSKILNNIDPLLDAEALRIVNTSPKWTPGKQHGDAVNVKLLIPIFFRN